MALRATLQKLEQTVNSPEEAVVLAELRRIVLRRIAEIDAAEAVKQFAETAKETLDTPLEELT